MGSKLMEIMRPEINEEKKRDLFIYVQDGQMTPEYAAGRTGQAVMEFISEMQQKGFSLPQRALA